MVCSPPCVGFIFTSMKQRKKEGQGGEKEGREAEGRSRKLVCVCVQTLLIWFVCTFTKALGTRCTF